jgi:hypothetical protein
MILNDDCNLRALIAHVAPRDECGDPIDVSLMQCEFTLPVQRTPLRNDNI